jgi:hypothetical protein
MFVSLCVRVIRGERERSGLGLKKVAYASMRRGRAALAPAT